MTATSPAVPLYLGPQGDDEADELAITHALLRRASAGGTAAAYRVYSPRAPTVVFGRRDTRLPGFAAAVSSAETHGFDAAVRVVGGRAVAYTPRCVVVDHVRHEPRPGDGLDQRFTQYGRRIAEGLQAIGVDAQLGRVADEYCPGEHSVNARGVVKLVGTAQRVVRDAWLFSALAVVEDRSVIQAVLTDVYRHLGLPFNARSVGALRDEQESMTARAAARVLLAAVGGASATRTTLEDSMLEAAAGLVADHRKDPPPMSRTAPAVRRTGEKQPHSNQME